MTELTLVDKRRSTGSGKSGSNWFSAGCLDIKQIRENYGFKIVRVEHKYKGNTLYGEVGHHEKNYIRTGGECLKTEWNEDDKELYTSLDYKQMYECDQFLPGRFHPSLSRLAQYHKQMVNGLKKYDTKGGYMSNGWKECSLTLIKQLDTAFTDHDDVSVHLNLNADFWRQSKNLKTLKTALIMVDQDSMDYQYGFGECGICYGDRPCVKPSCCKDQLVCSDCCVKMEMVTGKAKPSLKKNCHTYTDGKPCPFCKQVMQVPDLPPVVFKVREGEDWTTLNPPRNWVKA